MINKTIFTLIITATIISCNEPVKEQEMSDTHEDSNLSEEPSTLIHYQEEKHLANIKQLTFGGDNAEAYFNFDNSTLVYQYTNQKEGIECDQIYTKSLDENLTNKTLISTGKGRTTCAYFLPGDTTIIYASTHLTDEACPPIPDRKKIKKYVWPIYSGYELFVADLKGNIIKQLTDNDAYDAEATVSPVGGKVVFTSTRNGDLDLYTMNSDGSNVQQVTFGLGYDGGAFFSPDGTKLVFRSSRPKTDEEIREYKELLSQGLVAPTNMEVYVCDIDGSDMVQVTELGKANWAPFFHPSGEKIIFCSNHKSQSGYSFNLFMINVDGTGLEQVTYDDMFDSFPMFSFDGKKLIFASNRNNGGNRDTNLFIADWVE